jgi:hypothetical protein
MSKKPWHNDHLPPPPRLVRPRPKRGWVRGGLFLLLIPHIWIGLLLPGLLVAWLARALHFSLFSDVVPGRVTRLEVRRSKTGPNYHVAYTYPLQGMDNTDEDSIDEAAFHRLAQGDEVQVRVLAGSSASPQLLEPGARGPWGDLGSMLFVTVFWDGLMMFLVWPAVIRPLRQRSLVRFGLVATGEVTDKSLFGNRPPTYRIRYLFDTPAGPDGPGDASLPGKMFVEKSDYDEVRIGDTVTVLYDPRKLRRSLLYRFAAYEALPAAPAKEEVS